MLYWIFWWIVRAFFATTLPFKVVGRKRLPLKGSFILASNHLSYLDPPLIGIACRRKISFMARDSLFRNKIFSYILRHGEAFPIRRNTGDIRSLRDALRRLKRGLPVLIFPEGSRSGVREQASAQEGIGFLVHKSGVPVVPVKIVGSNEAMPPGSKTIRRVSVVVCFGEPLRFSKDENYSAITQKIMTAIQETSFTSQT